MFSSPCNLESYLRQWNSKSAKSIFPYSFFNSIESVSNQKSFPPKDAFKSELKKLEIDDETYKTAKQEYERRQALSNDDPDKIHTFLDWLRYYNLMDVKPLLKAIEICFENFHSYFKSDPMLHFSLPSLAFKAMFANYNKADPLIFSFNEGRIRKLFRDNIVGGLTNCFHRHVNLTNRPSPYNAKFAPSKDRFTSISFFDVNSMYLAVQLQPMPLTPGLEWIRNGNKFKKRVLQSGVSFKALQWIYFLQATRFKGMQIAHSYHRGEYILEGHKVDGYLQIEGKHVSLEFNGCYYHGHCKYHDDQKQEKWNRKASALRKLGTLISIYECEWDKFIKPSISTDMPRILCEDNHTTLLAGILSGELYGFVTCDVSTPVEIQSEFEEAGFLFPFIIRKTDLTEDLIR